MTVQNRAGGIPAGGFTVVFSHLLLLSRHLIKFTLIINFVTITLAKTIIFTLLGHMKQGSVLCYSLGPSN